MTPEERAKALFQRTDREHMDENEWWRGFELIVAAELLDTEDKATLAERERAASLPQPPARVEWTKASAVPERLLETVERMAYAQAWRDYAAAIMEEPPT